MGILDELKDMKFGKAYSELAQVAYTVSKETVLKEFSQFAKSVEPSDQSEHTSGKRNDVRFG